MHTRVLVDTSPIIFLSKLGLLDLLDRLFEHPVIITDAIVKEIRKNPIPAAEELTIENFLDKSVIVEATEKIINSSSLSAADNELLSYAIFNGCDLLITDDNLIRKITGYKNIPYIGTLGLILKGVQKKNITKRKAKQLIDELIEKHNFRISIKVYKKVLEILYK